MNCDHYKKRSTIAATATKTKRSKQQLAVPNKMAQLSQVLTQGGRGLNINYSMIRSKDDLEALVSTWYNNLSDREEPLQRFIIFQ